MSKDNTKDLVKLAIFTSLTMVMTMTVSIPIIGGNGYVNLGDMVIFLAAMFLGKKKGFIVGGIGSALADIFLGYGYYAPLTFIVKGLEGYIAGSILETRLGEKTPIFATVIGGIWMAFGYYLGEIFMYGTKAALVSIPANLVQGLFGAISAVVLLKALQKTKVLERRGILERL